MKYVRISSIIFRSDKLVYIGQDADDPKKVRVDLDKGSVCLNFETTDAATRALDQLYKDLTSHSYPETVKF